jgi:predicted nucleic acid-binding protein
MRTLTRYLADTYALIEAFTGHPRYGRIVRSKAVVTTALNVLELHYSLLRSRVSTEEAERLSRATLSLVVDVPPDVALSAARTRLATNDRLARQKEKARMSYIDAWGYEAARALGLPFLTGDPVFQRMAGVEFVR